MPTVQEQIHAPFEAAAWFAIMARAGTPADIVQKINAVANRYLQSAKAKDLIARQAVEAGGGTPADAAAFIKRELEKWEPVIKAANISLNLVGAGLGFQAAKLNSSSILRRLKP